MRGVSFVLTGVILWLASACTNGTVPGDGSSLSAAVESTLSSEGFHLEGTFEVEGMSIRTEGDYVAPDRMAISSSDGSSSTVTIIVGRENYVSEPGDPSMFSLWQMPCDVSVDTFIPALAVVRHAEDVVKTGDSFTFRADGNEGTPIEGEARVAESYLVELVLRYSAPRIPEPVEERWTFSEFGTTTHIEPPTQAQVLDESRFDANPPLVIHTGHPPACP